MALVIVGVGGTGTINSSGSDTVSFLGAGTLNIVGPPGPPINVVLSQVAGVGALNQVNISNANVTLGGIAGISAFANYAIGANSTFTLASTLGVTAGSTVTFTGQPSTLVLGNGINVALLGGIFGFGPGNRIDVSPLASSFTYADAPGGNTGGVITLRDAGGNPVGTVPLANGNYVPGNFTITPDGAGGTLIGYATAFTSITASPPTASLGAGQAVTFTVATTDPVTIAGGPPRLLLDDGGTAVYSPGASTPTSLVFTYTVAAGENSPDLAVVGVDANGATLLNAAAQPVNLAAAIGNPAGVLQIDTTLPTIVSLIASPVNGNLGIGQTATLTVATSEAVAVTGGTPTLTLNDGGTATFNAAASTPTSLVFTYTVTAGESTPDLAVTAANLNGATIADPAGNAVSLAAAVGNPAGILQVDGIAPIVTAISTSPASGAVAAGQAVMVMLAISEAVTVAGGTPTLTLSNGGTATFNGAGSTPTSLAFTYVVQPGDTAADLAVAGVNLNGAVIADAATNPANLAGGVGNPPGVLQIDTTSPAVVSVTTQPGSGTVGAGAVVVLTVATTEPVVILGGPPTLSLDGGGTATFDPAASTPTSLVFTYTVAPGQNSPDLTVTAVNLNGGTVRDPAGNAANLAGAVANPPGILQVDTSFAPFTSLVAGAADPGAIITVSASVRPAITGTYGNLGSGSIGPDGATYTVTGTAAQVNSALAGVRLSPAAGAPAPTGVNGAIINSGGLATSLQGGTGADALTGNAGDNVIAGGAGADTLVGGAGTDTLSYAASFAGVTVNLAQGTGTSGDAAGDVFSGFENVTGSEAGDLIIGDGQANVLAGLGGADTLIGGGGADTLAGGGGIDTLSYAGSSGGVFVDLGLSVAANGDADGDVISGFENVTGGDGSDTLFGSADANRIDGGAGNDGITGGAGADTIIGGDGFDLAYFQQGTSGVVANLLTGTGSAGEALGDTYLGIEGLVGTDFDDTLTGDGNTNLIAGGFGNDVLDGGGGDDAIFGQQGNDTMSGGDGNDLLRGGEGADAIDGGSGFNLAIYDTATAGVQVSLSTLYPNTGEAAGDTFVRIQGFLGTGFDDFLVGDGSSNLLLGGAGNDTLFGGGGYDSFDGGAGSDTFVFDVGFEFDTIVGFTASGGERDVLGFSTSVFASAQAALASVYTDPNGSAYVYAGGTNIVVLAGVSATQLTVDNFRVF